MSARRAVFLDRDGVLNELVPDSVSGHTESPLAVEQVRLIAGAASAAHALAAAGFDLVCVSNQPAAAKGKIPVDRLLAVHRRVVELLESESVTLRASRLCTHHPDGTVPGLTGKCACRKPAPGMLLEAADTLEIDLARSWMVGDTDADMVAGAAAGCRTVLIEHTGSAHKRLSGFVPDLMAPDLASGAPSLLDYLSETFG